MLTVGMMLQGHPPRIPPAGLPGEKGTPSNATIFDTPILVIEDEGLIAWMIESVLMEAGFKIIALASNGAVARTEARKVPPGLIISDVNLGAGDDGISTVRAIQDSARTPVIFVTGYANPRMRERLDAELPHAQLLRKPIDSSALISAAMRALAN